MDHRLAFLAVFVAFLLACGGGLPEVLPSPESRVIVASDGRSEVTLPAGWSRNDDLHVDAEVGAVDLVDDLYAIVLAEQIADMASDMTLEAHSELTRSFLTSEARNCETRGPASIRVNGMPAVQWELECDVDAMRLGYLHTTVAGERSYFQIVAWSLASNYTRKRPELVTFTQSLRELPEL